MSINLYDWRMENLRNKNVAKEKKCERKDILLQFLIYYIKNLIVSIKWKNCNTKCTHTKTTQIRVLLFFSEIFGFYGSMDRQCQRDDSENLK